MRLSAYSRMSHHKSIWISVLIATYFMNESVLIHAQESDPILFCSLDNEQSIVSPAIGIGGSTTLIPTDFIPSVTNNGAALIRDGAGDCTEPDYQVILFPAESGGVQNVELDQGELEFWYQPNYNAGADDDSTHTLVSIAIDAYNPPSMRLTESDELRFTIVDDAWNVYSVSGGYHTPLWTTGEWIHIRAVWDNTSADDSLGLYLNGIRIDSGGVAGGWDLGTETAIGSIMIGAQNSCGMNIAQGVIDEFIIRDVPQPQTPPSQFSTPIPELTIAETLIPSTPGPQATPTPIPPLPTRAPGEVGINDPNAILPPAPLPLQPVGTPFIDPVFGTTLRRVSDLSEHGGFETQIYSQLQAFSSDNQYMLLTSDVEYIIRRIDDLSAVEGLDTSGWNAPRWHPAIPHVIVHFDSNADTTVRVQFTDLDSLITETVFTFPPECNYIQVNPSFDEISKDGRWLAGLVKRNDGDFMIFSLNLDTMTLGAQMLLSDLYTNYCVPDPEWGKC